MKGLNWLTWVVANLKPYLNLMPAFLSRFALRLIK